LHCQPTIGWNALASIAPWISDTSRKSRTVAARSRVVQYRCSSGGLVGAREELLYHGAWPFTLDRVLSWFLVGSALGFIYHGSGLLWLVITIHSDDQPLVSEA
jgi:hypothetical protein